MSQRDTSVAKNKLLIDQCQISIGTILAHMFQRGLIALNVTQGHKQAVNQLMPNLLAQSQLVSFNEDQIILNTVSKVESLYQLVYFRYLVLQVHGNQRNYKFSEDTNIQHSLSLMYVFKD